MTHATAIDVLDAGDKLNDEERLMAYERLATIAGTTVQMPLDIAIEADRELHTLGWRNVKSAAPFLDTSPDLFLETWHGNDTFREYVEEELRTLYPPTMRWTADERLIRACFLQTRLDAFMDLQEENEDADGG